MDDKEAEYKGTYLYVDRAKTHTIRERERERKTLSRLRPSQLGAAFSSCAAHSLARWLDSFLSGTEMLRSGMENDISR